MGKGPTSFERMLWSFRVFPPFSRAGEQLSPPLSGWSIQDHGGNWFLLLKRRCNIALSRVFWGTFSRLGQQTKPHLFFYPAGKRSAFFVVFLVGGVLVSYADTFPHPPGNPDRSFFSGVLAGRAGFFSLSSVPTPVTKSASPVPRLITIPDSCLGGCGGWTFLGSFGDGGGGSTGGDPPSWWATRGGKTVIWRLVGLFGWGVGFQG